jgi:hypothetical protein
MVAERWSIGGWKEVPTTFTATTAVINDLNPDVAYQFRHVVVARSTPHVSATVALGVWGYITRQGSMFGDR